jgi:hypothetical protein
LAGSIIPDIEIPIPNTRPEISADKSLISMPPPHDV